MPDGHSFTATAQRAPRKDAVENERKVVEAALAVFGENGPGASMEEIAERAGVGIGTVYRRFPSKSSLLDALAARIASEMEAAIIAALADEDPGRGLRRFLEFVGEFNAVKGHLSPMLVERVGDQGVTAKMSEMVRSLTAKAVDSGALSVEVTAEDVLSLVKALRAVISATDSEAPWRRFLQVHLIGLREIS